MAFQQLPPPAAPTVTQASVVGESVLRPDYQEYDDPFGFGDVLRVFRRRARLLGATFIAALSLGAGLVLVQPPRYEATSLIQIGPAQSSASDQGSVMPSADFVQSQVALLRSRATFGRLAAALSTSHPDQSGAVPTHQLARAINVHRQEHSYVIEVTAQAPDPDLAAEYANGLVSGYFAVRANAAESRTIGLRDKLAQNLTLMRAEVQRRDQAVIEYRKAHGIQSFAHEDSVAPQLAGMRVSLGQALGDLADLDTRAIEGAEGRLTGNQAEAHSLLLVRESEIAQREADLSQRYGAQHPKLQAVRAELTSIQAQVSAENARDKARQSTSLNVEAQAARARVAVLNSSIAVASGQAFENSSEAATVRQLQREALVTRAGFEDQLRRFNELGAFGAPEAGDVQLVASATTTPTLVPGHRAMTLSLVAAIAGVLALLTALVFEQLDRRLRSSDDIPRLLRLPLLATVPKLSARDLRGLQPQMAQPVGFLLENPRSRFAEALRVLWINISHSPRDMRPRIIAVTSARGGEGKTSMALCLARTVSSTQRRVLLVGCDLRRRSLNQYLGIEPAWGIVDVLNNRCDLSQAIGYDSISGADVLAGTYADGGESDIFSSPATRDLLIKLSESYDLVILDTAPVLSFAEGRTLAALADGTLIVTRSGRSDSMASRAAAAQLESVGARILGVVLNGVRSDPLGGNAYSDSLYFDYARKGAYNT